MNSYVIAAFYKFFNFENYEFFKAPLLRFLQYNELLGTVLLAHEGINGSVAGTRENIKQFYTYMHNLSEFKDLEFKETFADFNPFSKTKVKLRKEIVTLGVPGVDPRVYSGTYISPEKWNDFISDPDVLLIDTRNDYEIGLGTFKGAINPKTENFRDFPKYVEKNLLDKKQKIAMFCTGGIRCEKSTAYLKQLGFEEVYHLKGGILNYLDKIPEENSLWQGTCFVFDDRIAIEV